MLHRALDPAAVSSEARYQLLTSLVVPRPIGWISTFGTGGVPNLAPFSYFTALAGSPMLVGVSVGLRPDGPKDTAVNLRDRGAFCVNIVDTAHLEAMNATSVSVGSEVDEFRLAGLPMEVSDVVDAPLVADCPAVLECTLSQEVSLGDAPNTLFIGEVVGVRVSSELPFAEGTHAVDSAALKPVGRLGGASYALPGAIKVLPRPR